MDIRSIEIFLAVCESGGLSAAARQLGITQGAISQVISRLESELGVGLLDRAARPPRLLPAGINLRQRGQKLLNDFADMKHGLERYRKAEVPEFRFGIADSLAPVLLPRLLPMLQEVVGTLSISAASVLPLVSSILRGEVDAAITSEPLDDVDQLELHPLVREPFILILPAGTQPPRSAQDLFVLSRSLTFLWYMRRRRIGVLIERYLLRLGIDIEQRLVFDSTPAILELIQCGLGWTISTPIALVTSNIDLSRVLAAPLPEQRLSRRIDFVAQNGLATLPGQLAEQCRNILEKDVKPRLERFAPFTLEHLVIGPD